jgi:5-methylcytosine-specific restriction enzyme subunit McrC
LTQPAVLLKDLSPHTVADHEEDAWLTRLAGHLADHDHTLRLSGGSGRQDDEDDGALSRGTDGRWWTGRFIGEINFEGRELQIAPRLGIDVVGVWLARALNLSVIPKAATRAGSGPLIAQLVDRMWSAALAEAGRHGPPRFRRVETSEGLYVRGRLDVPGTVALHAARVPKVASRTERRSAANPVSRAIVLADRTLASLLGHEKPWRPELAEELLKQLRAAVGANPVRPSTREMRRVRYAPISRAFEPVARLSLEIARRRGTLTSGAGSDTSGVLIDVAELWELFLLHCARRALGERRVHHGTANSGTAHLLASEADSSVRMGRLKPDLLILDEQGRECAVLDAKYKRLRASPERPNGVDRGDLYQLAAYLAGHPVSYGALAYPPGEPDDYALAATGGPWKLGRDQTVEFLHLPAEEERCVSTLRSQFGGLSGSTMRTRQLSSIRP